MSNEDVFEKMETNRHFYIASVDLSGVYDEEKGLRTFDTHRKYLRQEGQRNVACYLPNNYL